MIAVAAFLLCVLWFADATSGLRHPMDPMNSYSPLEWIAHWVTLGVGALVVAFVVMCFA